jgi:hypothetical protein
LEAEAIPRFSELFDESPDLARRGITKIQQMSEKYEVYFNIFTASAEYLRGFAQKNE